MGILLFVVQLQGVILLWVWKEKGIHKIFENFCGAGLTTRTHVLHTDPLAKSLLEPY